MYTMYGVHSTESTVWSLHGSAEERKKEGIIEYSTRETQKRSISTQITLEFTLQMKCQVRATNEQLHSIRDDCTPQA
jgi:hypothetical protein